MSTRELTGLRLSEVARCPRQAAYRGLSVPEDEPPYDVSLYYRRGAFFQKLREAEYAAEYGRDQIEVEREVPWPGGTGHADIYVRPTKTLVEVVSAVSPSAKMLGLKIEQVKRYLHYDPDAELALVEHIDPSRLAPIDSFPVRLTDGEGERIDREVAGLLASLDSGGADLPDRVCARPNEARQYLCPFASACFNGWEEPVADIDSPEAWDLGAEGLRLQARRQDRGIDKRKIDEEWRDWQLRCQSAGVPEGTSRVGGALIKRTKVKARESFRFAVARQAGALGERDLERLAPYLTTGEPHERWTIEQGDGEPIVAGDDYGEEAPW